MNWTTEYAGWRTKHMSVKTATAGSRGGVEGNSAVQERKF